MSNSEKSNIYYGIAYIACAIFAIYAVIDIFREKNKPITSEYFRYLKLEEAKKNGFTTFYSVSDGPINTSVNLTYDSFTEKAKCTLSNFGSFKFNEGWRSIYIRFKKVDIFDLVRDFYFGEDEGFFVKYRLDNGNILTHKPQIKTFQNDKNLYLQFPYYLFKDAKEVSIRYGQKDSRNNFVKTENFKTKTVDSIYNYYRLCKDRNYVPTN